MSHYYFHCFCSVLSPLLWTHEQTHHPIDLNLFKLSANLTVFCKQVSILEYFALVYKPYILILLSFLLERSLLQVSHRILIRCYSDFHYLVVRLLQLDGYLLLLLNGWRPRITATWFIFKSLKFHFKITL